MNFDNEQQLAMKHIRENPETDLEVLEEIEDQIIEPRDVEYYLNAFGDIDLAVKIHPLPPDLPDRVLKQMGEYDVLSDWQGGIQQSECPLCTRTIYEFDWKYDWLTLDEHGNEMRDMWYIDDSAGCYWDTRGEHHILCNGCANNRNRFSHSMDSHMGFKVYYGADDEWYPFSHNNGIVRWDGEQYMHNEKVRSQNLHTVYGERVDIRKLASAVASEDSNDLDVLISELGFVKITPEDVTCTTNGVQRTQKYAKKVLEGWADVTDSTEKHPTHPDFDFTYFIEDGRDLYVPSGKEEMVMEELNHETVKKVNRIDSLKKTNPGHV